MRLELKTISLTKRILQSISHVAALLVLVLIFLTCAVEPYTTVCTSKQDFQTNATALHSCNGDNPQMCVNAGGEYNEDELVCENVGIANPTESDQIPDFNSVPQEICGVFGYSMYNYINEGICADSSFVEDITQIQFNYCGGVENHKDICAVSTNWNKALCASEQDFQTDKIAEIE